MADPAKARKSHLTTVQHYRLSEACRPVRRAFGGGGPYLVGTATAGEFRDVDVRTILTDEEFDALFAGRERLWDLFCLSVSQYLTDVTGLPIDYQVQRMTEANAKHNGVRHALGMSAEPASRFAGGGDGTPDASPESGESRGATFGTAAGPNDGVTSCGNCHVVHPLQLLCASCRKPMLVVEAASGTRVTWTVEHGTREGVRLSAPGQMPTSASAEGRESRG